MTDAQNTAQITSLGLKATRHWPHDDTEGGLSEATGKLLRNKRQVDKCKQNQRDACKSNWTDHISLQSTEFLWSQ